MKKERDRSGVGGRLGSKDAEGSKREKTKDANGKAETEQIKKTI